MKILINNTILLLFILFVFGCKSEPPIDNNAQINIRLKRDVKKLNPIIYPSPVSREIYQYIQIPLADFHPESLELFPILIKEIPIAQEILTGPFEGGLKFEIEFLEDAVWDNGSPITAEDYIFTIKVIRNEQIDSRAWRAYFEDVVDITVDETNPRKFEVIYKEPYMLALEALTTINLYPKHIYDPESNTDKLDIHGKLLNEDILLDSLFVANFNGAKHSRDVVEGAGPYKLVAWEADQFVVLERKENYWGATRDNPFLQALPEKIIFKVIPDEVSALTLLESEELNVITGVSSANFEDLRNNQDNELKYNFHMPQLIRYYYLLTNNEDVILKDKNVRKAVALLTDIDQMISTLENGHGIPQVGHFHATKKYYNNTIDPIGFNVDEAEKLLRNSSWIDTDGDGLLDKVLDGKKTDLVIDVLVSKAELGRKVSLMLQESAQKIGMKINIVTKSGGEIRKDLKNGNYQLNTAAVVQDANADDPFARWHSQGQNNRSNYNNPKVDLLMDQLRLTMSESARKKIYMEIQSLMFEDVPSIFLYSPKERIVVSKKIEAKVSPKRPGYMANTFDTNLVLSEK